MRPSSQVFHLPDFDFNSTCFLLTDCLAEVRRWSGGLVVVCLPSCANIKAMQGSCPARPAPRNRPTTAAGPAGPPHPTKLPAERNPGHLPVVIFVETKQPDDVAAALGPDAVATIEAMLAASPLPGPDRYELCGMSSHIFDAVFDAV